MPSPKCEHAPQRTQCRVCNPRGWIANKWYTHQNNAKRRGIANELTREQYISIASRDCTYCHTSFAGGIDRVDNDGHYSVANSAPCCKYCNTAKGSRSVEEFLAYASRIKIGRAHV